MSISEGDKNSLDQKRSERVAAPIEIIKLDTWKLTDDVIKHLKLDELIALGYGQDITEEEAVEEVRIEYPDDKSTVVYLAMRDGRGVGSLALNILSQEEDSPFKVFWDELRAADAGMAERAEAVSKIACSVRGIVTHPSARRQGIATRFFQEADKELKPFGYVGVTAEAGVISTLVTALKDNRTFFGFSEVTPGSTSLSTRVHEPLLTAYMNASEKTLNPDGTVFSSSAPNLRPSVSVVDGFPQSIQDAFRNLLAAQQQNPNELVLMPFISAKRSLLIP